MRSTIAGRSAGYERGCRVRDRFGMKAMLCAVMAMGSFQPAAAQTLIRVSAGGYAVQGAEVVAWDSAGRVAAARTDVLGAAHLVLQRTPSAGAFLVVRRLGFVPARVELVGGDSIAISLTEAPTNLPVLSTTSRALRCPSTTEPTADSLWRTTASLYSTGAVALYTGWIGGHISETVSTNQRGYGDGEPIRMMGGGGTAPDTMGRGDALMREPPPYAMYERHVSLLGEYWRWRYAPLEDFGAEHFVSERFHSSHTVTMLGRSGEATVLGFCARQHAQADIEGELLIGPDGLVRAARWFYRVPHDDEDAGAEATFGRTTFEGKQYLVAVRGSSWRKAGKELYNQDRYERFGWRLGHTLEAAHIARPAEWSKP
jgi:hypothetical protein